MALCDGSRRSCHSDDLNMKVCIQHLLADGVGGGWRPRLNLEIEDASAGRAAVTPSGRLHAGVDPFGRSASAFGLEMSVTGEQPVVVLAKGGPATTVPITPAVIGI